MRRRFLQVLLALALGVCSLAFAFPASAVLPDIEPFHFEGTEPFTSCDGFDIIINFEVDGLYTAFFDQQGNLVREQIHIRGTGELVNTVTGKTETGSSPTMVIVDYKRGTETTVGLIFHNNIPGEGIVALSAGRITFNLDTGEVVFEGGPHPEFDEIDWCSMLA
jgi:hypothetical protein